MSLNYAYKSPIPLLIFLAMYIIIPFNQKYKLDDGHLYGMHEYGTW